MQDSAMAQKIFDACKTVLNDRYISYGDSNKSFSKISAFWTQVIAKSNNYHALNNGDVCLMMALMKISREMNRHSIDNIIDIINYLILYEKTYFNLDFDINDDLIINTKKDKDNERLQQE